MKSSLLKSMSFIAFLATATPSMAADPVVADVDGHQITYSEVMKAKESLPKEYQSAPDDKIFPVLLNQAVDTYLIGLAAKASGEAEKPETKAAIAKASESIVAQAYLISKLKDKITDPAVKAKYDEVIKNFPQEKEIHLRHILLETKELALSVIKALKNGTDFKKLAQTKSKDQPTAKEGGDLGWFRKGELPQELAEAAFALTPKTYSQEPVKTDFGWHVLMVEETRDAQPPKFEDIKNEIKSLMTQEAVVALLKDLRAKAKIVLKDKDGKPVPLEAPKEKAPAAAPTDAAKTAAPAPKAAPEATPAAPTPAEKK